MRVQLLCLLFILTHVFGVPDPVRDPSLWNNALTKHVSEGTLQGISLNVVDYTSMAADDDFISFYNSLASANLNNITRKEFYSFFINVYNVLAVHMITSHPCERDIFGKCGTLPSIRSIGTIIPFKPVWGMDAGVVGGKTWSLDEVEGHLRNPPTIEEDPRLHSAIVCASISCPNLRKEAYTPEKIDAQLTDNFNDFLKNTKKGMSVNQDKNKVTLSHIFQWFSGDFVKYAEKNLNGSQVIDFILHYLEPSHPDYQYLITNKDKISISYFNYNWDVNAKKDQIPCGTKNRPCYPLWALLVTLGSILIVTVIIVITVICIRRRRNKRSGYAPIQGY